MGKVKRGVPASESILEFFESPMWTDTIKDFILANCFVFTGEEEFSHEHNKIHQEFCKVIEDTLNIYLLEVMGISLDVFQKICTDTAQDKDSVGAKILAILKQVTDFRYFAAKMYAYNLMLDREAISSFTSQSSSKDSFFDISGATQKEIDHVNTLIQIQTDNVHRVERELGIAETHSLSIDERPIETMEKPSEISSLKMESVHEASLPTPKEPAAPKKESPVKEQKILQEEKDAALKKIKMEREKELQNVAKEDIQKRKEIIQKRKEELVEAKRQQCQSNIEINIKKHEAPVIEKEDDPEELLRQALVSRVRNIIGSN